MDKLQQLKEELRHFAKDRDWDQFHSPKNLSMAMSVEAAEIVEIFQWLTEDQSKHLSKGKVDDLADELADTYIYLLKLAEHYGIDLNEAAINKLKKNETKYPIEKSRGSAKKYSEF